MKGGVKGPAIVTEFLSQGSLRGVLARKSDVINGPLVRVLIAMDAAKVLAAAGAGLTTPWCSALSPPPLSMARLAPAHFARHRRCAGGVHPAHHAGVQGMEYLHSKKIVHFDLKSANLLLGHRDRRTICKVADFGLSKQKMDTYVSGVSSQRGTLPWIAPEIIKSPHAVNELVRPVVAPSVLAEQQRPAAGASSDSCE